MTRLRARPDRQQERGDPAALVPTVAGAFDGLLADCSDRKRISVGEIVDRLGESDFAVLVLGLVVPALLPVPGSYGMVFSTAVAILSFQMILGRQQPWLPSVIAKRSIATSILIKGVPRVRSWLIRIKGFTVPGAHERPDWTSHQSHCGMRHPASLDHDRAAHPFRKHSSRYLDRNDRASADPEGWTSLDDGLHCCSARCHLGLAG